MQPAWVVYDGLLHFLTWIEGTAAGDRFPFGSQVAATQHWLTTRRITAAEKALLTVVKYRVLTAWGISDQSVVS